MRVDKYISTCSHYSLREALRLIEEQRVKVNGRLLNTNRLIKKNDVVTIDEKPVIFNAPQAVYLAYNKPRGVECTADKSNPDNILDAINYSSTKLVTIGRLDKESE
jgi:23S rRNA pseudouridine2604 synthase